MDGGASEIKDFTDLRVWRSSMDLAEEVYRLTWTFPRQEQYGLSSQLQRAAVSVPSNIAEGQGRLTDGEWLQFLGHARGSIYEIRTQLYLCERLRLLTADQRVRMSEMADKISRDLNGLIAYVRRRAGRTRPTPNSQLPTNSHRPTTPR